MGKLSMKCTKEFWKAVLDDEPEEGTICKAGGKKRMVKGGYSSFSRRKMDVNRDRTVVDDKGNVKRYYWNCPVVEYDRENNKIKVDNCGYMTKTTKKRINEVLPSSIGVIVQRDFDWFLSDNDELKDLSLPEEFKIDNIKKEARKFLRMR